MAPAYPQLSGGSTLNDGRECERAPDEGAAGPSCRADEDRRDNYRGRYELQDRHLER